jgi:uncharacterized membrane protein (DUF485 family)
MRGGSDRPLVIALGWAIGSYIAAIAVHVAARAPVEISFRAATVACAGALYTNIFEHLWHRYAMHSRRPDPRHARHHQLFYGDRFQTTDPAALREIVTGWYIFPALLTIHYAAFAALFGAALTPAFFFGVVLHFVTYEATHWYTHVADNNFDKLVARIPGLSALRAMQIRHHRMHHAEPLINFNFTPPYVGDRVSGVLRR